MAVRVRPAEPADLARLVEIASHSATAAQWNQTEYLKLFATDRAEAQPQGNHQIADLNIKSPAPHGPCSGAGRKRCGFYCRATGGRRVGD